jgi:lipopolysaccharide transport system permease protein
LNNKSKILKPKRNFFYINFTAIWEYRDLLFIFIKRDYLASYKQTILGPVWHIIQPLFPTIMFTFVFGKIAKISTDGLPQPLFYLSGLIIWNYFTDCFSRTSNVFVSNAGIFGKVYFPRLITPLSYIISSLMRFTSQFILFIIIYFYYLFFKKSNIEINYVVFLFPFFIFLIAGYGLGMGLIISSISSKYRDLSILLSFFVGLLQYASCIIYPISAVPEKYRFLVKANPLTPIVEGFRFGFLSKGDFDLSALVYSFILMLIILLFGVFSFNKVERTFMDTV